MNHERLHGETLLEFLDWIETEKEVPLSEWIAEFNASQEKEETPLEVYQTGYYAFGNYRSKGHIVVNDKPFCGTPIDPMLVFQWCSKGINPDYVSCEKCRQKFAKMT